MWHFEEKDWGKEGPKYVFCFGCFCFRAIKSAKKCPLRDDACPAVGIDLTVQVKEAAAELAKAQQKTADKCSTASISKAFEKLQLLKKKTTKR